MAKPEREPRERETLIFKTPEEAQEFAERVSERQARQSLPQVRRDKEAVAQEVEIELDKHGEGPGTLNQPWEHTSLEHEEVQSLVEVAFTEDLGAALKRARRSEAYPRNIDLLHDVLTTELYAYMSQRSVNKQKLTAWQMIVVVVVIVAALLGVLLLLSLS